MVKKVATWLRSRTTHSLPWLPVRNKRKNSLHIAIHAVLHPSHWRLKTTNVCKPINVVTRGNCRCSDLLARLVRLYALPRLGQVFPEGLLLKKGKKNSRRKQTRISVGIRAADHPDPTRQKWFRWCRSCTKEASTVIICPDKSRSWDGNGIYPMRVLLKMCCKDVVDRVLVCFVLPRSHVPRHTILQILRTKQPTKLDRSKYQISCCARVPSDGTTI